MRPANILRLWRVRLRARLVQECLAIVGLAAGVALLFASQVSSSSLQSSVAELSRGVDGAATLELLARDPRGFPQATLGRVRRIPGVRVAAPLLEAGAEAVGPRGSESVELVGADSSLSELGGTLVRHTALAPVGGIGAVVLPAPLARTLGVTRFGQELTLQLAGHTVQAPLYTELHARQIGPLIDTPVALAPLSFAQEATGLGARVSRILVQPAAGAEARVRAALTALAGGRLNVEASTYDEALFAKAAAASNQSTALFAAISALVGFLFAFNAVLLTVPQRRRLSADLRLAGYPPRTVIAVMLLDAVALGLAACVLGLALGEELSVHVLHSNPAFLSLAFALGSQRTVSWQDVALAVGGGMCAAVVAVLSPLREVLSRELAALDSPRVGSGGAGASIGSAPALALAGLACLAGATTVLLAAPDAAVPGMVLLFGALLLELPLALSATLALVKRLAGTFTSTVPHVAVMELSAARARAVAIAATGAVAVFGSVAIQGAHHDLLAGLDRAAHELNAFTDVWVAPAGSYNLLQTAPFAPTRQAQLARLPGVRAVGLYRSGLLDYGERRVLVIAPPRDATPLLASDQLVQGSARQASARLRARGLAGALAGARRRTPPARRPGVHAADPRPADVSRRGAVHEHGVGARRDRDERLRLRPRVGQPGRKRIRGAARSWRLARPRRPRRSNARWALRRHGAGGRNGPAARRPPARAQPRSARAPHPDRHTDPDRRSARDGRGDGRARVAAPAAPGQAQARGVARDALLWRMVLLESLLLVGVGCVAGALFGLYGQQLADRALAEAIDFPVVYSVSALAGLESLALVIATALAILAVPGYLATPRAGRPRAAGLMGLAHDTQLATPTADAGKLTPAIAKRPYKQVARAQARQRTRDALQDAAIEEFTRGDWAKASLETLARRAGVTKQTLLRHYGSKDGLLMQALLHSASDAVQQRWSAPPGDVEGAVDNVLDHYDAWGERSLRVGAWLESGPPSSPGSRRWHARCTTAGSSTRSARSWSVCVGTLASAPAPR